MVDLKVKQATSMALVPKLVTVLARLCYLYLAFIIVATILHTNHTLNRSSTDNLWSPQLFFSRGMI